MVHQYARHNFGAKDFPSSADYATQLETRDNARQYPEAAKTVQERELNIANFERNLPDVADWSDWSTELMGLVQLSQKWAFFFQGTIDADAWY